MKTLPPGAGGPVLLLCAHGSTAPSARRATENIAAAVAHALPDVPTVLTWVDVQEPNVVARCEQFGDLPVVVVPLLLTAGYHVRHDLARAVAQRPHHVLTRALGPDRALSRLMMRRIEEAESAHAWLPGGQAETPALVMIAAGSTDERAVDDVHRQAHDLSELTGRPVRTGFVSAARPSAQVVVESALQQDSGAVTVVSFHVAPGVFHRAVVAAGTGATAADTTTERHVRPGPSGGGPVAALVTEPLLADGAEVPAEITEVVLKRWHEGLAALAL